MSGADPEFLLGGGALVSCPISTPINHIVLFFCRIPVVLENRGHLRGGGVRTPCTLPLHPPLNVSFPLDSSNDAVINVFFHVRTDHDGRGSFLEGYKKYCGAGWSMEQQPHESFKSIRNKNILFRNIYSNLNRHIFKWNFEKGTMLRFWICYKPFHLKNLFLE